jgi:hypothetical protein
MPTGGATGPPWERSTGMCWSTTSASSRACPPGGSTTTAAVAAPALERSRSEAAAATRAVRDTLAGLAGHPPRRVLRIQLQSAADAEGPEWSESTVGRELQFLVSHTVHHFALIRLLLGGEGPVLGPDFGVAPSTVAHTRTRA